MVDFFVFCAVGLDLGRYVRYVWDTFGREQQVRLRYAGLHWEVILSKAWWRASWLYMVGLRWLTYKTRTTIGQVGMESG